MTAGLTRYIPRPRDAVAYIMDTFPIVKRKMKITGSRLSILNFLPSQNWSSAGLIRREPISLLLARASSWVFVCRAQRRERQPRRRTVHRQWNKEIFAR